MEFLTTVANVDTISSMKTVELISTRIAYSELAFAEYCGAFQSQSKDRYAGSQVKYRLAHVVRGECVFYCALKSLSNFMQASIAVSASLKLKEPLINLSLRGAQRRGNPEMPA